jgi:hypothetical protein
MTSDVPGSGQPEPVEPPSPPADASPTEVVVPPAPPPAEPPAVEPPAAAPPAVEPIAAVPVAAVPLAAAPPPAGPPPAGQPPAPDAQPGQWGAPAPQQPPGWGAPPPGAAPQQPVAPQQPGWGPGPGAPAGAPPTGNWSPAPAQSSGNGCLKACLIVAVVLIVLAIVAVAALFFIGRQFVNDLGINPDTGQIQECQLVSNAQLNQIFGGTDAEAHPLGGIVDATVGQFLDKRILATANDCWIVGSGTSTTVTGRIAAADSSNASGDFQSAKSAAQAAGYYAGDVSGVGDEAFCTGATDVYSFGILARSGGRLTYVSLVNGGQSIGDWQTADNGEITSPATCQVAAEIAKAVLSH